MNSCMRCGDRLQHNYLVIVFRETKEKRERLIVCLKCRDILSKKDKLTTPEQPTSQGLPGSEKLKK